MTIKCSSLDAIDEDQLRPSSFGAGEPDPGVSRAGPPPQFGPLASFLTRPGFAKCTGSGVLFMWRRPRYLPSLAFRIPLLLVWLLAMLLGSCEHPVRGLPCPVMKYVQRRKKRKWEFGALVPGRPRGTHTALCSCTQMGPASPSEGFLQ